MKVPEGKRKVDLYGASESFIQEHIQITNLRINAYERYLNLLHQTSEFGANNVLRNHDVFIDLLKTVLSLTFTGLVALEVANPAWVNNTPQIEGSFLMIIFIAAVSLFSTCRARKRVVDVILKAASVKEEVIKSMLETENKCLEDMNRIHHELFNKRLKDLK